MPLPENYELVELFSADDIAQRVHELAARIDADYIKLGAKDILLVCVLRGACVFYADLLRTLQTPARLDFMQVSSYVGQQSSGNLIISKDIENIEGQHVLLVEDIVDTGYTMQLLLKRLQDRKPASLKLCSLLDKAAARRYQVPVDYVGFAAPEKFLVGYGLDYNSYFRGLPYIAELILAE